MICYYFCFQRTLCKKKIAQELEKLLPTVCRQQIFFECRMKKMSTSENEKVDEIFF